MRGANFERFDDLLGLSCSTSGTMFKYEGAHKAGRRVGQAVFISGKRVIPEGRPARCYPRIGWRGLALGRAVRLGDPRRFRDKKVLPDDAICGLVY